MMPVLWSEFIDALRAELEGFGELFRLIDNQRESILSRDAEALLGATGEIEAYLPAIESLSIKRRQIQREAVGPTAEDATVREVAIRAPSEFQPLLEALLDEVHRLIVATRKQLRGNHLLLQRAYELNQNLCDAIMPQHRTPSTYGRKGSVRHKESLSGAHYVVRT